MTILLTLWRLVVGNKVARAIGGALMAIAAVLTFGAIKKREGARTAKSDAAIKAARETIKAHEVRNEVENRIARERDAKQRLRDDWSE